VKAIVFLSLFLGLTAGLQRVEVAVDADRVAQVELRLDGESVGRLSAPPWAAGVDLGDELAPHRLSAVALDAAGREVERAEQWINLPRHEAEVRLLLVHEQGRVAAARLVWNSLAYERPSQVTASFDGAPLAVADPARIPLPAHDADELHVLSAEAIFADGVSARADLAFGGPYGEETSSALTSVAVEVDGRRRLRRSDEAAGWLSVDGRPAAVRALDRDAADLFAVVDRSAVPHLQQLGRALERRVAGTSQVRRGYSRVAGDSVLVPRTLNPAESPLLSVGMLPDDRLFLVAPTVSPSRSGYLLFGVSQPVDGRRGGLAWLLTRLRFEGEGAAPQRLADAVATTGLRAAASGRPRGVVLVLGPGGEDASRFDARRVVRYLGRLHVPVRVWYLELPEVMIERARVAVAQAAARAAQVAERGDPVPDVPPLPSLEAVSAERRLRLARARQTWGAVVDVDGVRPWVGAAGDFRDALARQRILWIDGVHAPSQVRLAGAPPWVRLAGEAP